MHTATTTADVNVPSWQALALRAGLSLIATKFEGRKLFADERGHWPKNDEDARECFAQFLDRADRRLTRMGL